MREVEEAGHWWGQVLLFAFTHINAIYTNALDCWRSPLFL